MENALSATARAWDDRTVATLQIALPDAPWHRCLAYAIEPGGYAEAVRT
jgi:hypothetical protein